MASTQTQTTASDSSSTLVPPKTSTAAAFRMSLGHSLGEWRVYLSAAIFVVAFTLILGIICLSFLKPKVEPLMFGLDIASILLSLGTFAALCFFIQRSKDQKYGDNPWDPNYVDILCALGIVCLFGLSSLAQLKELPKRCFSGPNADLKAIGPEVCGVLATMGAFSVTGGTIMLVSMILIALSIRQAKELAKLPPPVFPTGAEASVMRWLDRNDPFAVASRPPNPPDEEAARTFTIGSDSPRTPSRSNSLPTTQATASRPTSISRLGGGRSNTLTIEPSSPHNYNSQRDGKQPSRSNSLNSPGMTEVGFQGASIRTPGLGAGGLRTPGLGGFSNGGPMISAGVNPWGGSSTGRR